MKYLADENVPRRIVEWLRSRGEEVLYASEQRAGEIDAEWLRQAEADGRLVVTSDKDFGELVFRDRLNLHGVVLLRLGTLGIDARLSRLEQTWSVVEANPSGSFIVISPQKVRVRPLGT
jgi:predicted nuclease of predicted toxin-antitoxin system